MNREGPFPPQQPANLALIRERLRSVGFNEGAVSGVLQGRSDRNIDVAYAIRRTAEASPFHSLLRLFVLGMPLSVKSARAALSAAGMDGAIESGLIECLADGVRAVACLRPWRDFFLLSDFLPLEGTPLPSDPPSAISPTPSSMRTMP